MVLEVEMVKPDISEVGHMEGTDLQKVDLVRGEYVSTV